MARARAASSPDPEAIATFSEAMLELRRAAGNPDYRTLARRAGYSVTTLWSAAHGHGVPSRAVLLAYVAACGGDTVEWEQRWRRLVAAGRERPSRQTTVEP